MNADSIVISQWFNPDTRSTLRFIRPGGTHRDFVLDKGKNNELIFRITSDRRWQRIRFGNKHLPNGHA